MPTEWQAPAPACSAREPEEGLLRCTEPAGHPGDHVAEGLHGPVATWPQNANGGGEQ